MTIELYAKEFKITCEECNYKIFEHAKTKQEFIKLMRDSGWSIGKNIYCPKCNQNWK